jgi:hypothetical protein
MAMTLSDTISKESAAFGGMADALGGVATIVLAICGLAGIAPALLAAVATIVFGAALLIQGAALLSDYAQTFPRGAGNASFSQFGGSGLAAVFLVGAAGIALGVLAILGIQSAVLTLSASIAFGGALVLSSAGIWHLYVIRDAITRNLGQTRLEGRDILASEMASSSAGVQALGGLAAIVLAVIALAGSVNDLTLNLVALLTLGSTLVLTGTALSTVILSLMRRG